MWHTSYMLRLKWTRSPIPLCLRRGKPWTPHLYSTLGPPLLQPRAVRFITHLPVSQLSLISALSLQSRPGYKGSLPHCLASQESRKGDRSQSIP